MACACHQPAAWLRRTCSSSQQMVLAPRQSVLARREAPGKQQHGVNRGDKEYIGATGEG